MKSNLLSLILLLGVSISLSQPKNLQRYDPNELLQRGQADSSVVYAIDVANFGFTGQWEYALRAAGKSISFLYRRGQYSTPSYKDYFAAVLCCSECFDNNHPLVKELKRALQSLNEDNWLFRPFYNAPKQSFRDYQQMFAFALRLDQEAFAKAISLTYKELKLK